MTKILTSQNWEIKGETEKEDIRISFDRFQNDVEMSIFYGKNLVVLNGEQIDELKNILDSTKFIFEQS